MAKLNVERKIVAFGDVTANSNPRLKFVDWMRAVSGIEVANPKSEAVTLAPNESATIFDGQRTTTADNTTEYELTVGAEDGKYRFTWVGGTDPTLRTNRSVVVSGVDLTLFVNSNGTMDVAAGSGTPFSGCSVGDVVFIPGTSTGDAAGPFNSLNEGWWSVLGKTSTTLALVRFPGETFEGSSESVTPASNDEFTVFSSAGVQENDKLAIPGQFIESAKRVLQITAVTGKWVEFVSTTPIAEKTGIFPGANGITFYKAAKRLVSIESDQECIVRLNGDTNSFAIVNPILAGDPDQVGWFQIFGTVWSLDVVNNSTSSANVNIITAE